MKIMVEWGDLETNRISQTLFETEEEVREFSKMIGEFQSIHSTQVVNAYYVVQKTEIYQNNLCNHAEIDISTVATLNNKVAAIVLRDDLEKMSAESGNEEVRYAIVERWY